MSDAILCPSCQRKLQVPEALVGQDVQCPTCGATFVASLGGKAAKRGSTSRAEDDFSPFPSCAAIGDYLTFRGNPQPHRGLLILALGILGLGVCPPFGALGPVAWILGNSDLQAMRAGRMDPAGTAFTHVGLICGVVGTLLSAIIYGILALVIFGH
jgi:ribosomal protein S27E